MPMPTLPHPGSQRSCRQSTDRLAHDSALSFWSIAWRLGPATTNLPLSSPLLRPPYLAAELKMWRQPSAHPSPSWQSESGPVQTSTLGSPQPHHHVPVGSVTDLSPSAQQGLGQIHHLLASLESHHTNPKFDYHRSCLQLLPGHDHHPHHQHFIIPVAQPIYPKSDYPIELHLHYFFIRPPFDILLIKVNICKFNQVYFNCF